MTAGRKQKSSTSRLTDTTTESRPKYDTAKMQKITVEQRHLANTTTNVVINHVVP